VTEKSTPVEADREIRAWTETRTRGKLVEVPSRAAQGNPAGASSLSRNASVTGQTNRRGCWSAVGLSGLFGMQPIWVVPRVCPVPCRTGFFYF